MKMVLPDAQDVGDCGGMEKDEKQDAQQLVNVGTRISARKSNLSLMENL